MNFSNRRVKGFIREEEERTAEYYSGIIPSLQSSYENSFLTHCMRVLFDLKNINNNQKDTIKK